MKGSTSQRRWQWSASITSSDVAEADEAYSYELAPEATDCPDHVRGCLVVRVVQIATGLARRLVKLTHCVS